MRTSAIVAFLSLAAVSLARPITIVNNSGYRILAAISRTNGESGNDAYFPIEHGKSDTWQRDGPNETLFIVRPEQTGTQVATFYVAPTTQNGPIEIAPL